MHTHMHAHTRTHTQTHTHIRLAHAHPPCRYDMCLGSFDRALQLADDASAADVWYNLSQVIWGCELGGVSWGGVSGGGVSWGGVSWGGVSQVIGVCELNRCGC